jgi:hypothetical protein
VLERVATLGDLERVSIDDADLACIALDAWQNAGGR